MKALILLAHPEPKSFNGALFTTAIRTLAEAGHEVRSSDLYAMKFDPVSHRTNFTTVKDPEYLKLQLEELHASQVGGFAPEIEEEIAKLEWCDLMIWQFPLWWFGLPAILKGWVDRTFAMGRAYGGGRVYDHGLFKGRRAMLSLTTGGPQATFTKGGANGDIEAILRPVHRGILQFVGFDVLAPHICYGPVRQSEEERLRLVAAFVARLRSVEAETPMVVGPY